MEQEQIALIDLDETLVHYADIMNEELKSLAGPNETFNEYSLLSQHMPHIKKRITLVQKQKGFWYYLPQIEIGMEVYKLIEEVGFKTFILTKGPWIATNAWTEKFEWCKEYVPNSSVILSEEKSLVYGKVLFDDWPEYVNKWLTWRPRGLVLMLENMYNKHYNHKQVVKVLRDGSNLDVVKQRLLESYNR